MLSYRHAFHAGGPADVHKHALLWAALCALRSKAKPFTAVDLHAGEGIYDLERPEAAKTLEYQRGIARLWSRDDLIPALASYRDLVSALGQSHALARYPGSPEIVRQALRAEDRLIVNELHPSAIVALRAWAGNDRRIAVHHRDADEALNGLLPPAIRRGLLLVDPSYEQKSEYASVAAGAIRALDRWPEATMLVWYPRLADARHETLLQILRPRDVAMFHSEVDFDAGGLADAPNLGLRGSGVLVINPPWQFDIEAQKIGDQLAGLLAEGNAAAHRLAWINPDR